jgi:hypothetical protein
MVCVFNKFKFFILFLYFISLEVIAAVIPWNEREAIQEVEGRILLNCRVSSDFSLRQADVQSLVTNVQNSTQQFVFPIITWEAHTTLSEILSKMLWIHDRKSRNRHTFAHPSSYRTTYQRGAALIQGVESDPCPTYFQIENRRYKLSLNYNGSPATEQPGNYYLMQVNPTRTVLSFDRNITIAQFSSKDYQLHLLGEIARRKAIDPYRDNLPDEFSRIPVAAGIVMASKLIRGGLDPDILNRFWKKDGAYHLFSGAFYEIRRDNFNALTGRYMDRYGLDDEVSLANLLKMHAEEVFGYQDYESALQSLFI